MKTWERTQESFSPEIRIPLAWMVPRNRNLLTSPGGAQVRPNLRTNSKSQSSSSQSWSLTSRSNTTKLFENVTFLGPNLPVSDIPGWSSRTWISQALEAILKPVNMWEPQLQCTKNNRNVEEKRRLNDPWNEMLWCQQGNRGQTSCFFLLLNSENNTVGSFYPVQDLLSPSPRYFIFHTREEEMLNKKGKYSLWS